MMRTLVHGINQPTRQHPPLISALNVGHDEQTTLGSEQTRSDALWGDWRAQQAAMLAVVEVVDQKARTRLHASLARFAPIIFSTIYGRCPEQAPDHGHHPPAQGLDPLSLSESSSRCCLEPENI